MWITLSSFKLRTIILSLVTIISSTTHSFAKEDFSSLYGLWQWTSTGIQVDVNACSYNPDKICAIITNGEQKGSYVLRSIFTKDNQIIGKMIHPINGRSYDAQIIMQNSDTVNISGCTIGDADCQKSTWTRIKK